MPTAMFLVFVATILAGCAGAIHYVIIHIVMGKPVNESVRSKSTERKTQ